MVGTAEGELPVGLLRSEEGRSEWGQDLANRTAAAGRFPQQFGKLQNRRIAKLEDGGVSRDA